MIATDIVGILVTTIILGSIYGLVAIGMTLIYGTLRILDMSQGSMVMAGSFIGWASSWSRAGIRSWRSSRRSSRRSYSAR